MVANRSRPVAVVTGASSGIGAATAVALGRRGYQIVAGARRLPRVRRVVGDLGVAVPLVVTNLESIDSFVSKVSEAFGRIDVLVNNAGLALGLTPIAQARDEDWIEMWQGNVLGLMRGRRACMPLLAKAKTGAWAHRGLELNGEPIRVTEIAPGMVETEFSTVRFRGDRKAAKAVYQGVKPLVAEDIADCIVFAVTRPAHVDIDEIVIRPVAQAASWLVARKT